MVHIDAYVVLICVSSWRHPNDFHPNLLNFRSYLPFSKISFSSVQMICVSLQVFFVKHTDWLKLPFQFQGQAVVIFRQSSSFINQGTKVEILWHGSLCHLGETKKRTHSHEPSALIWGFPKMFFFSPKIIHFNRVFHYFHHPFGGTPIFGNTHLKTDQISNWLDMFFIWEIAGLCKIGMSSWIGGP